MALLAFYAALVAVLSPLSDTSPVLYVVMSATLLVPFGIVAVRSWRRANVGIALKCQTAARAVEREQLRMVRSAGLTEQERAAQLIKSERFYRGAARAAWLGGKVLKGAASAVLGGGIPDLSDFVPSGD